jgi:hypothetical protein
MTDNKTKSLAQRGGVTPQGKHNNAIGGDPRKPRNKGVSARPGFLGASATNDAPAISESFILEALLTEAEEKVMRKIKRGKKKSAAIDEVAADMDLTSDEIIKFKDRVSSKIIPAEPLALDVPPVDSASALVNTPSSDCIYFENAEEADQAAGILMYKGIPWKSKDSANNKPFIQFDDKAGMDEAHEALKRRWDFVESSDRKVAVVEFDNLSDYERVVEYMHKQGMLVDFGGDHELSEDAMEVVRSSKGKGKLKEEDVTASDNSYTAINRSKRSEREDVNVWDNRSQRVAKTRKRWR